MSLVCLEMLSRIIGAITSPGLLFPCPSWASICFCYFYFYLFIFLNFLSPFLENKAHQEWPCNDIDQLPHHLNPLLSTQGKSSSFPTSLKGLQLLTEELDLISKDQNGEDLEYISLLHVLWHQVHHPVQQQAEVFLVLLICLQKPFLLLFTPDSTPARDWLS